MRSSSEQLTPFALVTAAILMATLLLGGATHGEALTSLAARLLCIGLLGYCLWTLPRARLGVPQILLLAIIAMAGLLALLQLIPLPPSVWTALPGRALIAQTYEALGRPLPSLPYSLTPDATLDLLPGLAIPAAFVLATARLNAAGRRLVTLVILAAAAVSLFMAVFQLAGGTDSPLRIYRVTNDNAGVGLFANRNHQASLLVAAIPLTVFWAVYMSKKLEMAAMAAAATALAGVLFFVLGLGITLSRAGVVLGAGALAGGLGLTLRSKPYHGRWTLVLGLAGSVVVGAALISFVALGPLAQRFKTALADEGRIATAPVILDTAKGFGPLGAGFGAFVPAYQVHEPANAIGEAYLNHAHNDYLELWVEAGWAGLVLAVAAIAWVAWRSLVVWTRRDLPDLDLCRTGSLIASLILIHCLVDYPLRTAAMAAVMGVACALMSPQNSISESDARRR